jgi:hypothetical protein
MNWWVIAFLILAAPIWLPLLYMTFFFGLLVFIILWTALCWVFGAKFEIKDLDSDAPIGYVRWFKFTRYSQEK